MSQINYEDITIENSISAGSKAIFVLRETYDKVFPDIVGVYDSYNQDNILYGRVDPSGDVIHANEFYLRQVNAEAGKEVYCFDFVADAFEDFENSIKVQYARRVKQDDFFAGDWSAERGWESPHAFYDNRMSDANQVFIKGNLFLKNNKDNVKNIDDFIKIFLDDFCDPLKSQIVLTKSGLLTSKYYNPATTGLCVEIDTTPAGLDSVKFEKFIKSPNFEFYLLTAAKHGFIVDKNVPWRLIANLNSPRMKEYMALYNLNSGNIFESRFIKTYKYDVQNLKVYIKQFYDSFLSISPNYITELPVFGTLKCPPSAQSGKKTLPRQPITDQQYNEKYDNLFWLKAYYRLKLNEKNTMLSQKVLKKDLEKIQQLYNSLDFDQTLDYINDRIKSQTS